MKFLIDECLSPELTKLAHAKGHGESSHVVWLGRAGLKDWELKPIILNGDWIFVTKTRWISAAQRNGLASGPIRRSRPPRRTCLPKRAARHGSGYANRTVRARARRVRG